jgi:hypothetical protein
VGVRVPRVLHDPSPATILYFVGHLDFAISEINCRRPRFLPAVDRAPSAFLPISACSTELH